LSAVKEDGARRAALVTGGSNGIGLAIAELLGELGYGLTILSRRPRLINGAGEALRERGFEVQALAADVREEAAVIEAVKAHEERFGRLDVLVNNAGLGIGGPVGEAGTEHLDLQLDVDLRAVILFTRESLPMLEAAGAEHGGAMVLNTSSIAGKAGHEWLSVYSAAKHGVVGYTQALNRELNGRGIKACALCPGYVDTDLTEYLRDELPRDEMISTADIVAMVRGLLALSRWCVVPEIVFQRPGDPIVD
jgi:NAD(P)-dependent dehydrogenase (short-subunit alcohol dehydrogenase family)